jgi:DNA-binding Lrp family transcriptional regulator
MAKQCISIVASEETYMNLKPFEDIKQLNKAVRTYKEQYQGELSKTAVSVLDILHRYAAKFTGVSFLTKNNIASMLGKSRRTIIRVCQQLEQLGIIRQYEMKRKSDMKQTSNAIVIQPIQKENVTQVESEKPVESSTQKTDMSHQKDFSFKTSSLNNNHLNTKRSPYIKFVPKSLQHYQAFFGKKVKDLYGRVWLAAKKLGVTVNQDVMQHIGFIALDQLKTYTKQGKCLTEEEQYKLVYKIGLNQIKERLESGEIIDWNWDVRIPE